MTVQLHWLDAKRHSYLHVGCVGDSIADLYSSKSGKSWRANFELPGCFTERVWLRGTLKEAKALCEMVAQQWFGLANTSQPITDKEVLRDSQ